MLLHFARMLGGLALSRMGTEKFRPFIARLDREDLGLLAAWAVEGIVKPVIDVRRGLESVPQAIADFAGGHSTGKLVVTLG
jgi:NADPH-dependent curcumin reductase CurA